MPRRLTQQPITLSDLEWPFHYRALSLLHTAEHLVNCCKTHQKNILRDLFSFLLCQVYFLGWHGLFSRRVTLSSGWGFSGAPVAIKTSIPP